MERATVSLEQRLMMQPTGKRRAELGKVIPVDQMRRLSREPQLVTEYVAGYVGAVADMLAHDGIQGPADLGLNESFMHIVLSADQDMTSGMEGLADGTRAVGRNEIYWNIEKSAGRHYSDGYVLGSAFSDALLRRGNFESLAHEREIPEELVDTKNAAIEEWLAKNKVDHTSPHVILHLHPYARLGFAFRVNAGTDEFDGYLDEIAHRHTTNPEIAQLKTAHLEAVRRGFEFADRSISAQAAIDNRFRRQ